jgi:hypothetical protein
MTSHPNLHRVSVFGGYLWLALTFQLMLLAFLAAAVIPPAALVYAVFGVVALAFAAILFTHAPSRSMFLWSAVAGSLSTLAGLTAGAQPSALPVAFALVYSATAVAAALVSVGGARLASRLG